MNLRQITGFDSGYYKINREERNLAAIFYHVLLEKDNLEKFVNLTGSNFEIITNEMGIYFEYAFIRDLWNNITQGNNFKRKLILDFLSPPNRAELENKSILEFNQYFGAARAMSGDFISSPSNWSMGYYNPNIPDNTEFLNVCKFKWCFNAKPDIVINTSHNHAICIEAKFESVEGKYPSNENEKRIFKERGLELVGQLEIQKMIMEEILGIRADYIFLVQNKTVSATHKTWTWKEVFAQLDIKDCPFFIKEWLKRL